MKYYFHEGKNLVLNKTELRQYFGIELARLQEGQIESSGFIVIEDKTGTYGAEIRKTTSSDINTTSATAAEYNYEE